jgi:hypothetical protein
MALEKWLKMITSTLLKKFADLTLIALRLITVYGESI